MRELRRLWPEINEWMELTVTREGEAVGVIRVEGVGLGLLQLSKLFIESDCRGLGHGSWLLDTICGIADDAECDICLEAFWDPRHADGGRLIQWYATRVFIPEDAADGDNLAPLVRHASQIHRLTAAHH